VTDDQPRALASPRGVPFAKGHGTQNDFVLVPDPAGRLDLDAQQVAALCDRRAGIGGDGLIRVIRASAFVGESPAGLVFSEQGAEWFMDYRNSDGSPAEMCGNGLRVFVAYLERLGYLRLADGERVAIGTRAGVKTVRRDGDLLSADLGPWFLPGGEQAVADGYDVRATVANEPPDLPGLSVDVGNPHVVVALPDVAGLAAADLTSTPRVRPLPVHGTNVELVVPLHDSGAASGHLRLRVHERGVGETRSCGTGAVAAVLAARAWAGPDAPRVWRVDVPGGVLRVTTPAGDPVRGDVVELAGPAVIVAEGTISELPAPERRPVTSGSRPA